MAFEELRESLGERQKKILQVIEKFPNSTDREILQELNLHDMNMVRPRVTELIKEGFIEESGSIQCAVTNRRCRTVRVLNPESKNQLKFNL